MIVGMENYKFQVKRVTHLKAIDTITPYPISFLEQCYFSCLMPFLASNINKEKHSCFWVTEIGIQVTKNRYTVYGSVVLKNNTTGTVDITFIYKLLFLIFSIFLIYQT